MRPTTHPMPPSLRQMRRSGNRSGMPGVDPLDGGMDALGDAEEHTERDAASCGGSTWFDMPPEHAWIEIDGAGLLARGEERVPVVGLERGQIRRGA